MPKSRKNKKTPKSRVSPATLQGFRRLTAVLDEHRAVVNAHATALETLRAFLQPLVAAHRDLYPADALAPLDEANAPKELPEQTHPLYPEGDEPEVQVNTDELTTEQTAPSLDEFIKSRTPRGAMIWQSTKLSPVEITNLRELAREQGVDENDHAAVVAFLDSQGVSYYLDPFADVLKKATDQWDEPAKLADLANNNTEDDGA